MSTSPEKDLQDVQHKNPRDYHTMQIWLREPPIRLGVLTADGMTQIAEHKYRAGSYTKLDEVLSPGLWQPLTDMLPMWLAPNLVTTVGGFFCLLTFILSSVYSSDPPQWLYFSNGICMILYYTLDCMDGKQARRTGSSSPLGQLFDHGMDCICNLSHLQLVQSIVLVPPHLLLIVQASLQFAFWQAQWEEYYTGILPHATGQWCGVTEVNYGLATWSIMTGIFGRGLYTIAVLPGIARNIPFVDYIVGADDVFEVRHLILLFWMAMVISLVSLSWIRVYKHVKDTKVFASAMSKFLSPLLLCVVSLWGLSDRLETSAHAGSLSMGLCFCLITIKIIVYSMARMAYATWQLDILPFVLVVTVCGVMNINNSMLFTALDLLYFARLLYWVRKACAQLCERLDVELFRIPIKEA